jgi:hypothetical protein
MAAPGESAPMEAEDAPSPSAARAAAQDAPPPAAAEAAAMDEEDDDGTESPWDPAGARAVFDAFKNAAAGDGPMEPAFLAKLQASTGRAPSELHAAAAALRAYLSEPGANADGFFAFLQRATTADAMAEAVAALAGDDEHERKLGKQGAGGVRRSSRKAVPSAIGKSREFITTAPQRKRRRGAGIVRRSV